MTDSRPASFSSGAPTTSSRIRHNVAWNMMGLGIYSASNWLLIAIVARENPSAAGSFGIAMSIVTPVFLFASLNLKLIQAVDGHDADWLNHLVIQLGVLPVGSLLSILIAFSLGRKDSWLVVLIFAAMRWVEALSNLCYGVFMTKERFRSLGIGMALRGILGTAMAVVTWRATQDLALTGLGILFGWTLVLITYEFPSSLRLLESRGVPEARRVGLLVRRGLPLGFDSAANSLIHHVPRLMIAQTLGPLALGRYLPIVQLLQYLTVAAGSLGGVLLSRLSKYWRDANEPAFRSLIRKVFTLSSAAAIAVTVASLLVGPAVIRLLLGSEFIDVPLIATSGFLAGVISIERLLARGLQAAKRFKEVLLVDLLVLGITTAGCFALVPLFDSAGATASMSIGFATGLALVAVFLSRLKFVDGDRIRQQSG